MASFPSVRAWIFLVFWGILWASKASLQDIVEHVDGVGARKAEGLQYLVEVAEGSSTMLGTLHHLVEARS